MPCKPDVAMSFRWCTLFTWALFLFLSGCHTPSAPIDYRPQPPSEKINYHLVSQGETLFSIAWRYEKDVQKLARANGIAQPYTIYGGQRLTLDTSRVSRTVRRPSSNNSKPSAPSSSNKSRATPKATVSAPKPTPSFKSWQWQWPVQGNVSKSFGSSSLFKGVDVQSFSGAPVVAAAPGVVVYSGSGLRGYGQLIIVKHSNVFLSAYAHNRKIFVKEGQPVNGGQKISEVGGDPSNRKRLYFEIRKDGKPVDPLRYLPKR